MSILGASLSDLKKRRTNNRFSLSTVLRTSRQMLVALKDVHEMGIIHRDIKPANFVIGHKDPKRIFLIDFGLASEFHTGEERENIGFRGTNTYASVRIHQYKDPGRVDDLVSWFYCTLRILGIKFPWDKIKIPPKTERCGSKTIDTLFDKLVANGLLEQHLEEDQKQHLQNNLNDSNNNHQSNFEINSHAILKSESKKSKKNSIVVDKESVYMNTSLMHQSSANAQSSKRSSVKTKSPILSGLKEEVGKFDRKIGV